MNINDERGRQMQWESFVQRLRNLNQMPQFLEARAKSSNCYLNGKKRVMWVCQCDRSCGDCLNRENCNRINYIHGASKKTTKFGEVLKTYVTTQ